MTIWAVDADLIEYEINLAADLPAGQADWSAEIAKAQDDVLERVKSEWWEAQILGYKYTGYAVLDETKLNTALLKQLVCIQTLGFYIMPKLSRFADDDDSFTRKAEYYRGEADREWNKVNKMSLYDFNGDDAFTDLDRAGNVQRRWRRG